MLLWPTKHCLLLGSSQQALFSTSFVELFLVQLLNIAVTLNSECEWQQSDVGLGERDAQSRTHPLLGLLCG